MKDLPPPPEPAFANWCAEQINPPALCEQIHATAAAWSFEYWSLVFFVALALVCMVAYLVHVSRLAYLGGRYCDALGGYANAARHLANIEQTDEARLAGALSIHTFTKDAKK